MDGWYASPVGDLPAASLAVTNHDGWFCSLNINEQLPSNRHRNGVLLDLITIRSGDSTARNITLQDDQPRDQSQNIDCWSSEAVRPVLAWGVVRQGDREWAHIKIEISGFVLKEQEFIKIVGLACQQLGCVCVEIQQLGRFFFQGQRAAGRGADDGDALVGVFDEFVHVARVVTPGGGELAVREERKS